VLKERKMLEEVDVEMGKVEVEKEGVAK